MEEILNKKIDVSKFRYIIAIDPSSSCTGLALLVKPTEDGTRGHYWIPYFNEVKRTYDPRPRRIHLMIRNVYNELDKLLAKIKKQGRSEKDVLVIMNTGYMATVGIDQNTETYKLVEYGIKLGILDKFTNFKQILDSSWMGEIKEHFGVTGKLKRDEKKKLTIRYVNEVIAEDASQEKKIQVWSDDVADAIAAAYFVSKGIIKDQSSLDARTKRYITAVKKLKSAIKKDMKAYETRVKWMNKTSNEIELKRENSKEEDRTTKSYLKYIGTREDRLKKIGNEICEIDLRMQENEKKLKAKESKYHEKVKEKS